LVPAGVMELCTKGLGGSVPQLKSRGINLSCVRTCVVVAEERPRIQVSIFVLSIFVLSIFVLSVYFVYLIVGLLSRFYVNLFVSILFVDLF
jgi:hypothetical protein